MILVTEEVITATLKSTFVVAEITVKVVVINSSVVKITFEVAEINFKDHF